LANFSDPQKTNFANKNISKAGIEALICIRNAFIHNSNDLSLNRDTNSRTKVSSAQIPGVALNGSVVTLVSNRNNDFMEFVRMSLVAVAKYQGDG
jgi:hypothetical protein